MLVLVLPAMHSHLGHVHDHMPCLAPSPAIRKLSVIIPKDASTNVAIRRRISSGTEGDVVSPLPFCYLDQTDIFLAPLEERQL